jgi:hypothetical protein
MTKSKKEKKIVANINIVSGNRESISECLKELACIVESRTKFCVGECVSRTSTGVVAAEFDLKITEVKED